MVSCPGGNRPAGHEMMEVCFFCKNLVRETTEKEVMEGIKLSRFYIKIFKILI